jgi:periplasmic protein TonB
MKIRPRWVSLIAIPLAGLAGAQQQTAPPVPVLVRPPPGGMPRKPPPASCKNEPYPNAALRAEATGQTVLAFMLDSQGFLESTTILKSAGASPEHKLLDAASVRSLWSCRFSPPPEPGVVYQNVYTWRLEEVKPN